MCNTTRTYIFCMLLTVSTPTFIVFGIMYGISKEQHKSFTHHSAQLLDMHTFRYPCQNSQCFTNQYNLHTCGFVLDCNYNNITLAGYTPQCVEFLKNPQRVDRSHGNNLQYIDCTKCSDLICDYISFQFKLSDKIVTTYLVTALYPDFYGWLVNTYIDGNYYDIWIDNKIILLNNPIESILYLYIPMGIFVFSLVGFSISYYCDYRRFINENNNRRIFKEMI